MRKAFVATVMVFQLVLLAVVSFITLNMRSEMSVISENERRIVTYKLLESSNDLYSDWLKLNESNANSNSYVLYKNYILTQWEQFYPALDLNLYSFNNTILSFEVTYTPLNIRKSYYVER